MRRTIALALVVVLGVGCGSSGSSPTATDAGSDLGADVATMADVVDAAMVCDVGAPPVAASMLPQLRSTTIILDGDAGGTFPVASGGDPVGQWLMTAATFYLPAAARGQVVPERTTLTGTGWGVIEGNQYRLSTSLELALETVMVGTVRRPIGTGGRGTFTQMGGSLALNPVCSMQTSGMAMAMLGFSRDSMDRGRLFADVTSMIGRAVIVFDLERVP